METKLQLTATNHEIPLAGWFALVCPVSKLPRCCSRFKIFAVHALYLPI